MQINSTNMLELTSGNNESVEAAAIMPRNYEVVPSKDERNYTEEQLA